MGFHPGVRITTKLCYGPKQTVSIGVADYPCTIIFTVVTLYTADVKVHGQRIEGWLAVPKARNVLSVTPTDLGR